MKKGILGTIVTILLLFAAGCSSSASTPSKTYGGVKVTQSEYEAYTSFVTASNAVNNYILGKESTAQASKAVAALKGKMTKPTNPKSDKKTMKEDIKELQSFLKNGGVSIYSANQMNIDLAELVNSIVPGKYGSTNKKTTKIITKIDSDTVKLKSAAGKQTQAASKSISSSLAK